MITDDELRDACAKALYDDWAEADGLAPPWDETTERSRDVYRRDVDTVARALREHQVHIVYLTTGDHYLKAASASATL